MVIAREDNTLQGVGLHTRQTVFEVQGSAAFNACCFTSEVNVIAGTQDGCVYKYDVRNTSEPLNVVQRTGASILSMAKLDQGTLVTTGDGCCVLYTEDENADVSLTGPDCDPVYKARANKKYVYTACRDATIRKYIL